MTKLQQIEPRFVEFIPEKLALGTLYVSMTYATVAHLCCCGCGHEVVTPLAPNRWKMLFDGRAVSLSPSVGNWSFACQSHYWIRRNRVEWANRFSPEQIERVRANDWRLIEEDMAGESSGAPVQAPTPPLRWYERLQIWRRR